MKEITIRELLHNYIEIADSKKLNALYALVEDDIGIQGASFTMEEKQELDRRMAHYLLGGEMVSPLTMSRRLKDSRRTRP